mmetsp:Transcript_37607/g.43811  ORF Transcript_37607/g.43811 Transcript_37607/m.43811 type:complete len:257 (+) Transcript_37607:49-819(+)
MFAIRPITVFIIATRLVPEIAQGTFLGGNEYPNEYRLRKKIQQSLNKIPKSCEDELQQYCPLKTLESPSIKRHEHESTIYFNCKRLQDAMSSTSMRHARVGALSHECENALFTVRHHFSALRRREEENNGNMLIRTAAFALVAVMSALASYLILKLNCSRTDQIERSFFFMDAEARKEVKCEKICVYINMVLGCGLLLVVLLYCPFFLLAIIPPFLIVQALHYWCRKIDSTDTEYQMVSLDPNSTVIFSGVPVDLQ